MIPISQRTRESFWKKVDLNGPIATEDGTACWEWTAHRGSQGYGTLGTFKDGSERAHRFSWRLHRGPIPTGMWVLHRCDNSRCVRPDHLFLGTAKDNSADMITKGRMPQAKLNRAMADAIRTAYRAGGSTQAALGKLFRISDSIVNRIIHGKAWVAP